ncbi:uncharacterized protein LOC113227528 [Hyposmocoma kahamanoa]|uniref:uncharacterized protein LOC113227528 n=1 Tax=Hyposmocoma kahamanoa TaxID=1477025 RepID=UPI000E6D8CDE|nr:uncharacterized protein LOC113227528 [Hyposmocoma kahamanoa]
MNHTCSQCNFSANFESALAMHHQLHHENDYNAADFPVINLPVQKCNSVPRDMSPSSSFRSNKGMRLTSRTSSATKILGRLRARICKNKALFSHPEEPIVVSNS